MPSRRIVLAGLLAGLAVAPSSADDWPQFRGPARDGVSKEKGLLQSWPDTGPPLAWTAKGLGGGYSTVSVSGDRIYTLGNKGKDSFVVALSRADGKVLWTAEVGPAGGSLGCIPTVDGDKVYALGQMGDLVCIDRAGQRVWARNLAKEFGGQKGGWNYCESPLVDGDRVIVTPGGKEATMVALEKATGKEIWRCPIKTKHTEAGYSSVVVATVGGIRHYVQLFNGGLVGVSLDGRVLWTYEKLGANTANVPTPIVMGDYIFSSIGYGRGASLLHLTVVDGKITVQEVYYARELTNKHGGVIQIGDYVYGDTDDSGHPYCAEAKTGRVIWKRNEEGTGRGSASVTYADGRLYFHYDNGTMALVDPSPGGYREVGSFAAPKRNGASWAHPVVSNGRLYLREGDMLYCYDVRAKR
ncbi:MAG TPA: PQQ-binding-like beta-propeller repeat protein [Urbifossiella sp.]|jgi:outer membrane protein assembly factor BamB|nr:PQQ-binding-like beta-propeller repeat protein [Urbifossiella sp.]